MATSGQQSPGGASTNSISICASDVAENLVQQGPEETPRMALEDVNIQLPTDQAQENNANESKTPLQDPEEELMASQGLTAPVLLSAQHVKPSEDEINAMFPSIGSCSASFKGLMDALYNIATTEDDTQISTFKKLLIPRNKVFIQGLMGKQGKQCSKIDLETYVAVLQKVVSGNVKLPLPGSPAIITPLLHCIADKSVSQGDNYSQQISTLWRRLVSGDLFLFAIADVAHQYRINMGTEITSMFGDIQWYSSASKRLPTASSWMGTPTSKKLSLLQPAAQDLYESFMMEIAYAAKVATSKFIENADLYQTLDEDDINTIFGSEDLFPSLNQYVKNALEKFVPDTSLSFPRADVHSSINTEDLGCGCKCTTLDQWDTLFAKYLNLEENKQPITNWLEWSDYNSLAPDTIYWESSDCPYDKDRIGCYNAKYRPKTDLDEKVPLHAKDPLEIPGLAAYNNPQSGDITNAPGATTEDKAKPKLLAQKSPEASKPLDSHPASPIIAPKNSQAQKKATSIATSSLGDKIVNAGIPVKAAAQKTHQPDCIQSENLTQNRQRIPSDTPQHLGNSPSKSHHSQDGHHKFFATTVGNRGIFVNQKDNTDYNVPPNTSESNAHQRKWEPQNDAYHQPWYPDYRNDGNPSNQSWTPWGELHLNIDPQMKQRLFRAPKFLGPCDSISYTNADFDIRFSDVSQDSSASILDGQLRSKLLLIAQGRSKNNLPHAQAFRCMRLHLISYVLGTPLIVDPSGLMMHSIFSHGTDEVFDLHKVVEVAEDIKSKILSIVEVESLQKIKVENDEIASSSSPPAQKLNDIQRMFTNMMSTNWWYLVDLGTLALVERKVTIEQKTIDYNKVIFASPEDIQSATIFVEELARIRASSKGLTYQCITKPERMADSDIYITVEGCWKSLIAIAKNYKNAVVIFPSEVTLKESEITDLFHYLELPYIWFFFPWYSMTVSDKHKPADLVAAVARLKNSLPPNVQKRLPQEVIKRAIYMWRSTSFQIAANQIPSLEGKLMTFNDMLSTYLLGSGWSGEVANIVQKHGPSRPPSSLPSPPLKKPRKMEDKPKKPDASPSKEEWFNNLKHTSTKFAEQVWAEPKQVVDKMFKLAHIRPKWSELPGKPGEKKQCILVARTGKACAFWETGVSHAKGRCSDHHHSDTKRYQALTQAKNEASQGTQEAPTNDASSTPKDPPQECQEVPKE